MLLLLMLLYGDFFVASWSSWRYEAAAAAGCSSWRCCCWCCCCCYGRIIICYTTNITTTTAGVVVTAGISFLRFLSFLFLPPLSLLLHSLKYLHKRPVIPEDICRRPAMLMLSTTAATTTGVCTVLAVLTAVRTAGVVVLAATTAAVIRHVDKSKNKYVSFALLSRLCFCWWWCCQRCQFFFSTPGFLADKSAWYYTTALIPAPYLASYTRQILIIIHYFSS